MDNRIKASAIRLAIRFTDKADLPKRFSAKKEDLFQEEKKDSVAERNFQITISTWENFLYNVLSHENNEQIWRLISIAPYVEKGISTISLSADFIAMTEIFNKIRNHKNSSPELIGRFSQIYTAFQKEIERQLSLRD